MNLKRTSGHIRISHPIGSLLQGHDKKRQLVPQMRGIVHEPQVNIGADQKFSPVDVFKQKKKGQILEFQWID